MIKTCHFRVVAFPATAHGLLSGFEFEKQMYMTKDEIIKRVEWMTKSSVALSQPVLVYNDGFKDGANFVLQNLQQTDCYTALELLNQELSKLDGVITYGSVHAAINIAIDKKNKVLCAMELIKELQANAV